MKTTHTALLLTGAIIALSAPHASAFSSPVISHGKHVAAAPKKTKSSQKSKAKQPKKDNKSDEDRKKRALESLERNGITPEMYSAKFQEACETGNYKLLNTLLAAGIGRKSLNSNSFNGAPGYFTQVCGNGHTDCVKLMIKYGADVNDCSNFGTPMLFAIRGGHIDCVKLLIDSGASLSDQEPLIEAATYGQLECIKLLLKSGADINQRCIRFNSETALSEAARHGHRDCVKFLLANPKIKTSDFSETTIACMTGNTTKLQKLIKSGADINKKDTYGTSPIYYAAVLGYTDCLKMLIDAKATIGSEENEAEPIIGTMECDQLESFNMLVASCKEFKNASIMNTAICDNHEKYIPLLLKELKKINREDLCRALCTSIEKDSYDHVKLFYEAGADTEKLSPLATAVNRERDKCIQLLLSDIKRISQEDISNALYFSTRNNREDYVKQILKSGAKPGSENNSALVESIEKNNETIFDLLMEAGANPNSKNTDGELPLIAAARHGRTEMLKCLLDKGANVNAKKTSGIDALQTAVDQKHLECAELLIKAGVDKSQLVQYLITRKHDKTTPLTLICKEGNSEWLKFAIKHGVDVNASNGLGETPLSHAAYYGHAECVKILLDAKAKVDDYDLKTNPNHAKNTPLICAAIGKHIECMKLLIKAGANVNHINKYGNTALITSVDALHAEGIKLLINAGADIDYTNHYKNTALFLCALRNCPKGLKLLIEAGGNMDIKCENGNTALIIALLTGHEECFKLLLKEKANPNIQGEKEKTALMHCLERGNARYLHMLLDAKADFITPDKEGITPLDAAIRAGNIDCVTALVRAGADINHVDKSGDTPLVRAAAHNRLEIGKYLIKHGADINLGTKNTPVRVACRKNYVDFLKLLIEAKANINSSNLLLEAAHYNCPQVIKYLLEINAYPDPKYSQEALKRAEKRGHKECIKLLSGD